MPSQNRSTPAHFLLLTSGFWLLASPPTLAQEAPPNPPAATAPATTQPTQDALEKAFADRLTNAVMDGYFTLDGQKEPRHDKYTIVSVRKLMGENWLFNAKVQYRGNDLTIPMIVPVKWAGDTPMISVTNFGLPGMGSYTARVLIYGDQYAGTWSANATATRPAHGGHMWGKITKAPATQPATPPK